MLADILVAPTEGTAPVADNIAQDALDAQNLDKAVRMRAAGHHWTEVAKACGFPNARAALKAVGDAMAEATMRAELTVDQYRDEANLRLERLLKDTLDMLGQDAPETYDAEGNPQFSDDRPVKLRAVDEARRLVADIVKLNGADQPTEDKDTVAQVLVVGINPEDIV